MKKLRRWLDAHFKDAPYWNVRSSRGKTVFTAIRLSKHEAQKLASRYREAGDKVKVFIDYN